MPRLVLTKEQLAPLLQGTWTGADGVFELLVSRPELLTAAVRRAWGSRSSTSLYQNQEDLTRQVLIRMVEKTTQRGGLPFPEDRDQEGQPAAWLFTVLVNEARSLLCREKHYVGSQEPESKPETAGTPTRNPLPPPTNPTARLEAEQHWQQVVQLQHRPEAKAHHLLALWATEIPRFFQQHSPPPLKWTTSLPRPAPECWALLATWASRHPYDHHSDVARRELGWILCVGEPPADPARWWEDAARWRLNKPDEAAQVRNLVSKWCARAARLLEQP